MTNRPIRPKGYSKKELLEIIEGIDIEKQQVKNRTEARKETETSEIKKIAPALY